MAFVLQTIDSDELEKQRIGYINISLSEWTSTSEPQYTAGSCFEDAGSLYYVDALTDCGTDAQWGAIGNNTLVYGYFDVSTLAGYWSSTAPAWDTAKQGWYLGASPTHRCLITVYKDGSGNYIRKNIMDSRRSLYRKNYSYETDEHVYTTSANSFRAYSFNTTNNVNGSTVYTTKTFYLRKPCYGYLQTTAVSGAITYAGVGIYVAQNNGYRTISSVAERPNLYNLSLFPGRYKLIAKQRRLVTDGGGVKTHSLLISGAWGLSSMSAKGLIDT